MLAWLLQCATPNAEQAATGRLLAALLLFFGGVVLLANGVNVVFSRTMAVSLGSLAALALFAVLYAVNRRGGVSLAAAGSVGSLLVLGPLVSLGQPASLISSILLATLAVITVTLAGVLLTWRAVLLVTLLASLEVPLVFYRIGPALVEYRVIQAQDLPALGVIIMAALGAAGGLAAFSSYQMRQTLGQLRQQNEDLAAQSARERLLIEQMLATAARISSSAHEIAAVTALQTRGATEQAAIITQVTGTVEELSMTAVEIAAAADHVSTAAAQALLSAANGQDAVRAGMAGMRRITERINEIVARNLTLSSQSQRVGLIMDTISALAAQTHILALNAAIESAGAGEHGQRFAVVAAEVKKLAQRSAGATREVREIISQNQAAIAAAVMATEEGLKEGDRGLLLAQQSGAANAAIITEVETTAHLATAISLATQQQRTASEQVVLTMREMVGVTQQVATSSREMLAAVNALNEVAQELNAARAPADSPAVAPLPGAAPHPAARRAPAPA